MEDKRSLVLIPSTFACGFLINGISVFYMLPGSDSIRAYDSIRHEPFIQNPKVKVFAMADRETVSEQMNLIGKNLDRLSNASGAMEDKLQRRLRKTRAKLREVREQVLEPDAQWSFPTPLRFQQLQKDLKEDGFETAVVVRDHDVLVENINHHRHECTITLAEVSRQFDFDAECTTVLAFKSKTKALAYFFSRLTSLDSLETYFYDED